MSKIAQWIEGSIEANVSKIHSPAESYITKQKALAIAIEGAKLPSQALALAAAAEHRTRYAFQILAAIVGAEPAVSTIPDACRDAVRWADEMAATLVNNPPGAHESEDTRPPPTPIPSAGQDRTP
jgi:hypothetical protein